MLGRRIERINRCEKWQRILPAVVNVMSLVQGYQRTQSRIIGAKFELPGGKGGRMFISKEVRPSTL